MSKVTMCGPNTDSLTLPNIQGIDVTRFAFATEEVLTIGALYCFCNGSGAHDRCTVLPSLLDYTYNF